MANPGPNIVQSPMNLATIAPGAGMQVLPFGPFLLASFVNGDIVTNYVFGFKGRIMAVKMVIPFAATTALKLATFTPALVSGGVKTNITGGVIALTSALATPSGAVVNGTPITALNAFGPADGLTITVSGVTAFVEGQGVLEITYINDDTNDAIARGQIMYNP
jgi:hypothetical protein